MSKTTLLLCITTAGLFAANGKAALPDPLDLNQLPPVVQRAIHEAGGDAGIASVQRVYRFGTPVYEVRLGRPGASRPIFVTDAGTVIKPSEMVASVPPRSREVMMGDLPLPVQDAIRSAAAASGYGRIEAITANGRTIYEVPARLTDGNRTFWFDPAGNLLAVSRPRPLMSRLSRVEPADLPAPVQERLRTLANGAPIMSIERGVIDGRTYYDAILNQGGRNTDVRLAADGSLAPDSVNDRFLAESGQLVIPARAPLPGAPVGTVIARAPLVDPQPLSFNQLPAAVVNTVREYAGNDLVPKIERGTALGENVYEATLQHGGQLLPLRIREDGSLANDPLNSQFVQVLRPAAPATVVVPDWQTAPPRVILSDIKPLRIDQVPGSVQDGLRYYAGSSRVTRILQGTIRGEPYYDVTAEVDGHPWTLRFTQEGALVDDQADDQFLARIGALGSRVPIAVGQPAPWSSGSGSSR